MPGESGPLWPVLWEGGAAMLGSDRRKDVGPGEQGEEMSTRAQRCRRASLDPSSSSGKERTVVPSLPGRSAQWGCCQRDSSPGLAHSGHSTTRHPCPPVLPLQDGSEGGLS